MPTSDDGGRARVYAGFAAAAGMICVAIVWLVEGRLRGQSPIALHQGSAAIWVLDTLPLVLGVVGWQIGEAARARTEARRTASELESIEGGLSGQALASALIEGVLLVEADGTVLRSNPAADLLFGTEEGELEGRNIAQLLPEHPEAPASGVVYRRSGGVVVGTEWLQRAVRPDGTEFRVQLSAGPTTHRRALIVLRPAVEHLSHDASLQAELDAAREERDQAIESSRLKSQFLAEMSHELRTPLNAIIGYAELGAEEAEQPELQDDLQRIASSGRHLLSLINDLLDLSKIESGGMSVLLEPCSIATLLEDVRQTVEPLVTASGNALVIELGVALPRGRVDPMRLRQALINLAGNASKFTEAGTVTLGAAVDNSKPLPGIAITVRDTGCGMTPAQLEAAFKPFVQVSADRSKRKAGTGLGLPLAARFVEMMGGEITARSEVGVGTSFSIWVAAEEVTLDSLDDSMDLAAPGLRTLLVIDADPPRLRQSLARRLEGLGFDVVFGELDGSAQALVQRLRPHALLVDPVELDQLRLFEGAPCPVILFSPRFDLEQALAAGATHYSVKPPDWDILSSLLD